MHHIQRSIIDQLMHAKIRRFSELRPDNVESNLFQYHLRHVIKEGFVDKIEGGYVLSPKGLYYTDRHSTALRATREQPKIITILAIYNLEGHILLQYREKQPFIGTYNLPAGKIHTGESIEQAAKRELVEKTLLRNTALRHVTTAHVKILIDSQIVSEYIAFVYRGDTKEVVDDALWYDKTRPGDIELAPSVLEIIMTLDDSEPSLHEIEIRL